MDRLFLDTSDWDTDLYPIPPKPLVLERGKCVHTPVPSGYTSHAEWGETAMKKGLTCITCEKCGLWSIWMTKAAAKVEMSRRFREAEEADRKCRAEVMEKIAKRKIR